MQQRIVDYADLASGADAGSPATPAGGTFTIRDGALVNTLTASQAAAQSLAFIGERLTWLAPLLESVAVSDKPGTAQIFSLWSAEAVDANAQKHEEYCAYLRQEMTEKWPWLLALFDACSALILVIPGSFSFCTSRHLGIAFEVPQLHALTHLTPFAAEAGETIH